MRFFLKLPTQPPADKKVLYVVWNFYTKAAFTNSPGFFHVRIFSAKWLQKKSTSVHLI